MSLRSELHGVIHECLDCFAQLIGYRAVVRRNSEILLFFLGKIMTKVSKNTEGNTIFYSANA